MFQLKSGDSAKARLEIAKRARLFVNKVKKKKKKLKQTQTKRNRPVEFEVNAFSD